jgi:hypothetical protein
MRSCPQLLTSVTLVAAALAGDLSDNPHSRKHTIMTARAAQAAAAALRAGGSPSLTIESMNQKLRTME